jgi:hypothetical protein
MELVLYVASGRASPGVAGIARREVSGGWMVTRLVLYGIFGCFGELLWTSMSAPVMSLARRTSVDVRLPAMTYLWMFPIYAHAGLIFELIHGEVASWAWPLRGLVYMLFIFIGEYLWGFIIQKLTGKVPWDYTGSRFSVHGRIRLDYGILWFGIGLLTEWTEKIVGAAASGIDASF